jgi:hypothetical protein
MIGAPMQKSKGKNDLMFPCCPGIQCWCLDCVMDSLECEIHVFEPWSKCDEKAYSHASEALKQYYIKLALKK